MLNLTTGQHFPARCKANFCPWCGPKNADLLAGAIAQAKPERAILLTDVGDDWQTVRGRMKVLSYRLRRRRSLNWCWHVEPNPKGTGQHIHAWQYGDFYPQRMLSATAGSVGMGRVVYINRNRSKAGTPLGYGMKLAGMPYGLKMAQAAVTLDTYLEANGNRLVHATRGFWRDEDGQALDGQREAMRTWASRNRSADGEDKWVLVREEHLSEALAGLGSL